MTSSLPGPIEEAQRRLSHPEHAVNIAAARDAIQADGTAAGPHVIADSAEATYRDLAPRLPPGLPALMGRISLTVGEVAPALGLSERTVRKAIADGEIPSVMVGGRRLVPIRALERHLEALAYAEAGTLDLWEQALARATSVRISRARRLAAERRQ